MGPYRVAQKSNFVHDFANDAGVSSFARSLCHSWAILVLCSRNVYTGLQAKSTEYGLHSTPAGAARSIQPSVYPRQSVHMTDGNCSLALTAAAFCGVHGTWAQLHGLHTKLDWRYIHSLETEPNYHACSTDCIPTNSVKYGITYSSVTVAVWVVWPQLNKNEENGGLLF